MYLKRMIILLLPAHMKERLIQEYLIYILDSYEYERKYRYRKTVQIRPILSKTFRYDDKLHLYTILQNNVFERRYIYHI